MASANTMASEECISDQDLKAFAVGQLEQPRADEIVAHLSVCPRCEETVAALDDTDDSLLKGVREAASRNPDVAVTGGNVLPVEIPEMEQLRQIQNPWTSALDSAARVSLGEWIRDYELLEPLGQGGMGTVYKARHARLNRAVAIKLLPARRLRDAAAVGRFEREMKAIGCLDHPAIVRATDAGDAEGTHFLVMDFVDGIDLSQVVKLSGPLDVATACEVIRQAAAGLQYAHEQGLIHRDVKPGNLMVTLVSGNSGPGGGSADMACVKLLDLGLALFGAASEAVDELTTVGQLMGTLDYMAPEQADNCHDVDVRADVYSLGATLFKLLTGTAPYETSERQSPLRKMKALATVDAPPLKSRRPDLPDDIAAITDRMLKREPDQRYQTAAEVSQAVAPFCAGHQLVERTKNALRLRTERVEPDVVQPPSDLAAVLITPGMSTRRKPISGDLEPQVNAAGHSGKPPRRRSVQVLLAAMGFFIVLAAGVLFRIETDCGTLVIECAEDNVPVEIRQGNVPIKQLSVSTGKNQVTLRSGEYEVIIPAEYETMHVEAGIFELRRGDQWVARIVEEPKPEIAAAAGKSGDAIQPDPPPTASSGRQSSEASGNDDMVRKDAIRKDKPENAAAGSMQYSLLSLEQLRELYVSDFRKRLTLDEEATERLESGSDDSRVRDLKRQIERVTKRLNEVRIAINERTADPDESQDGTLVLESSEPGKSGFPEFSSNLQFPDPLQQIEFEAERDRYALVMRQIPEFRQKHQVLMDQIQSGVNKDDSNSTLEAAAESASQQLAAALKEADELRSRLDSMLEPIRLARQIEELLTVSPEEITATESRALIPEEFIQKILKEADEAERIRRVKNPEKTSQVFTNWPESLCRQILDLREEFESRIGMRQTLRESLRIEGRASLISQPELVRRLIEDVRSANRECENYRQSLRKAVAELKAAVAEEASKRTGAATGSMAGGRAGDSGTEVLFGEDGASPTFQGRTFDHWKSILTTERSGEELAKAVEAIGTLGRGTREPEAIELILKLVEQSPPVTTDLNNPSKSGLAAVRVIREIDAKTVASVLTPGFSDRSDKIHAFVLIGLMNLPDLSGTDGNATNRLAERAPVRQAMISSETFALELVRLIEKRSGLKTSDPALTQKIFSAPSIYSDFVPGYATSMIFEHIGKNKPGPALEQFLTRLLDHLAQTPLDQKLPWEAFAAASILARFSPNEKLPGIFVRIISEELDSSRRTETLRLKADAGGKGFFPATGHGGLSDIVRGSFENLSRLGAFAESALPFMLEIVGKPAPEGTSGAVAFPNQIFHEGHVLYLASKADSDPSVPNRDASTIAGSHRGFAVNLRLLGMEVIVSSGTKDPKVLDLLRAELKKQLGQEPTDGPHELVPGREFLLLRDDPNAAWKGPGTSIHPSAPSIGGGGGFGTPPVLIPTTTSPLDVELVNSTLLAWKSITGSWPRFAEVNLGQLGDRTLLELGQVEMTPEKTLEFLPKFQPVAGL